MTNIKKFILLTFFLFFTFSNVLNADVVKKIQATGNERISLETIVIFADIEIGKNYESSDISQIIKKLYDTTFFFRNIC